MKKYALIGASGYIAPRHMKAIKDTNNELIACMDPFDSVGIIDSYFPKAKFFTEIERFDRHLDKQRRIGNGIDYLSICSPNYLHDSHIRFGLRQGASVICEKPLVLNPWNIDALEEIEKEFQGSVYNILQLRLHPAILELKERIKREKSSEKYDVDLSYFTSRGAWYHSSWKGNIEKSGGIATNIGVHFYDMLSFVFGPLEKSIVHLHEKDKAAGYLEYKNARVRWFLSINEDLLPKQAQEKGMRTYRSITVNGEEVEFSGGFTELHTESYKHILDGNGFGLNEARTAIETVHNIRTSNPIGLKGDFHPMAK